ncbi:LysR family transcriptional regulator [Arthrobacter sp. 31Y]|uniref:LysR family transcriptional regulator n=1 Tax=Arthrobacter sp. 31Y TaxID=1115632 RepID=UPI000687B5F9|nr:LysR family transcriptional regulator [Arthrobacter sp. 31Y]
MRTFLVVAEELNFGRAATRLHIAQPAVSQQIMSLEKSLGVKLFERNTRSVSLTDAGLAFLQPCRDAVTAIESAGLEAKNAGTGEFGRIRVGFNAGFAADALSTLFRSLRGQLPRLQLEVDSSRTNVQVMERISSKELDIGLVGGPVHSRDLEHLVLGYIRLGVQLPRDHPMIDRSEIRMRDLAKEPFILIAPTDGPSIRSHVLEMCAEAGFQPRIAAEVGDGLTVMTLIGAGVGVGFSSSGSTALKPAGLEVRPIAEAAPVPCALVWKKGSASPALRNVLRVAAECFSVAAINS